MTVYFGTEPSTSVTITSMSEIQAVVPRTSAPGWVDVIMEDLFLPGCRTILPCAFEYR